MLNFLLISVLIMVPIETAAKQATKARRITGPKVEPKSTFRILFINKNYREMISHGST